MKDSIQIVLKVSYKADDLDPNDVAMEIGRAIEKELKRTLPNIGEAFANLINGERVDLIAWLDPEE